VPRGRRGGAIAAFRSVAQVPLMREHEAPVGTHSESPLVAGDAKREALDAAAGGASKSRYVRRIFSEIAPSYDLLNHVLSLNVDRAWRGVALRELGWERRPDGAYLDLCAGTHDVGARLARDARFEGLVVAADFAEPMLRAGRDKAPRDVLVPVVADALALPIADRSMSGAFVAFGILIVADLDGALREVHRVLEPGARFVILEFSTPRRALVRIAYHAYFHAVLPGVGRLVSGHPTAYSYLPKSVENFPTGERLANRMTRAGLRRVRWRALTLGIAAIHVGERE
jgi:demethylmenaquinone methyltransferase/2-methoxy-6-polyprenyl-1,4-benzoquinol methylase